MLKKTLDVREDEHRKDDTNNGMEVNWSSWQRVTQSFGFENKFWHNIPSLGIVLDNDYIVPVNTLPIDSSEFVNKIVYNVYMDATMHTVNEDGDDHPDDSSTLE